MIEVLGPRVLIKPDTPESVTKSGIILIHNERQAMAEITTGVIVSIGDTAYLDPILGGEPWVKVGDRVVYAKYGGKFLRDPDDGPDGVEYVLLIDEDVQCRVTETSIEAAA